MPYPKTQTALMYDAETEEIVAWGYPAATMALHLPSAQADKCVYIDRVKLLLDEEWAASAQGRQVLLRLPNRSIPRIIADFLGKMIEQIRVDFGTSGRTFDVDSIRWVLTVPAMWTDASKDLMREAAFLSGMIASRDSPNLVLCFEPEAALLSSSFPPNDMAFDDVVLSVDVGGGTADMSAMEMTEDATAPFGRKFNEVIPSRGTVNGSIIIDTMFEKYIEDQVGHEAWTALRNDTGAWAKVMAQWVSIKCGFDPASPTTADLTLPRAALKAIRGATSELSFHGLLSGGLDATSESEDDGWEDSFEDTILIPAATLLRIIGPVVDAVVALAAEMVRDCDLMDKPVAKVFVVGGFASSRYLLKQLRAALQLVNPAISVAVPSIPGSAVLTGAVLYGMAPKIVATRVLQRTYGFGQAVPTADARFEGMDTSEWAPVSVNGVHSFMHVFTPLATKGESVSASEMRSTTTRALINGQQSIALNIFAVEEDLARVIRTTNPLCKQIGAIEIATTPGSWDESFEVKLEFGSSEIQVYLTSSASGETRSTPICYDLHE
ncbi:hypothetical protein BC828DRAFT_109799 [Blastocladiella britannica]|nr:hypothetical protein BC828DRAFT_109799 [Blastocladiella britannica]